MSSELVIDQSNFSQYFHDVRTNQPKRGQVMARYAATADLIDGGLKRDLIDILCLHETPETVVKLMRKIGCATERDSWLVPLNMARDLLSGETPDVVAEKPYKFVCEAFFYTQKENIPLDDPHWSCVTLSNLDEFLDAKDQRLKLRTRVLTDKENELAALKDRASLMDAVRLADAENILENDESLLRYGHDAARSSGEEGLDDPQTKSGAVLDG
jgi:hypothetical protein